VTKVISLRSDLRDCSAEMNQTGVWFRSTAVEHCQVEDSLHHLKILSIRGLMPQYRLTQLEQLKSHRRSQLCRDAPAEITYITRRKAGHGDDEGDEGWVAP
jgi:hypothetical protein